MPDFMHVHVLRTSTFCGFGITRSGNLICVSTDATDSRYGERSPYGGGRLTGERAPITWDDSFDRDAFTALLIEACVQRIAMELPSHYVPAEIVHVVTKCHQDLSGMPASALPELVERLARYRLMTAIDLSPPEPIA